MDFLDDRLIEVIGSGRCFALVGSGPSSAMGYPSWTKLAQVTLQKVQELGKASDLTAYEKFLKNERYPELFALAERDVGGRQLLISLMTSDFIPPQKNNSRIYEFLAQWPFACYLTTNYDDELDLHLRNKGCFYKVVQNRLEDFFPFHDGASNLIMKLHGDFEHPENLVLTSDDYLRLESGIDGLYFRERLKAIIQMFNICIIGHSLSDRNLTLILQTAKNTANPAQPIFMIAPNFTQAEKHEYFVRYNIIVSTYDAYENHKELERMLQFSDGFIIGNRKRSRIRMPSVRDTVEVEAATALLIYRKLNPASSTGFDETTQAVGPLILYALANSSTPRMSFEGLFNCNELAATFQSDTMKRALRSSLDELSVRGLVEAHDGGTYSLSEAGKIQVKQVSVLRKNQEDLALGQFWLDFSTKAAAEKVELSAGMQAKVTDLLKRTLVKVFKVRGLAIARAVFFSKSVDNNASIDIFRALVSAANSIEDVRLRPIFGEVSKSMVLTPSGPQTLYLSALSQGFFLYHLAGLDPEGVRVRKELFNTTNWLFDSSILLPLLAIGSNNHDYAKDLFTKLENLRSISFTTRKLLDEVTGHLAWAIREAPDNRIFSLEFLERAVEKTGFKQNLFIDGYIRLVAEGSIHTFGDYVSRAFPHGTSTQAIFNLFKDYGIHVVDLADVEGFDEVDYGRMIDHTEHITAARQQLGTYRNPPQVKAEAEVLQLVRGLKSGKLTHDTLVGSASTFFVSQSRVLDRLADSNEIVTWTPESLYRYIALLPGNELDPELLQQCMLHTYYKSGISFIDTERYARAFGDLISQAKLDFEEQKRRYINEAQLVDLSEQDFTSAFESTPDLEKPFFVQQMQSKINDSLSRRVDNAQETIVELKEEVAQLKSERDRGRKLRDVRTRLQLEAEERNRRDPKHLRKRQRQAKKRARRK